MLCFLEGLSKERPAGWDPGQRLLGQIQLCGPWLCDRGHGLPPLCAWGSTSQDSCQVRGHSHCLERCLAHSEVKKSSKVRVIQDLRLSRGFLTAMAS